jgi:hypothetical protein
VYAVGPASRVLGCADPEHENTSMTARGPELDSLDPPTDDMPAEPDADPDAELDAEPANPPGPPSPPARRRVGALPLALAAVAVLAGAALFLSG